MLFQLWSGQPHRPTRDLDLLGQGDPDPDRFEELLRDICQQEVEDDGLEFHTESIRAERMREGEEYQGLRLKLLATLATVRIPIQIDIGFGDSVYPGPNEMGYPTMLDLPAPTLMVYPRETVVAEKYQAMVMLGIANSRMKDFYDLWTLAQQFEFSGPVLSAAIRATFARRKTTLPEQTPLALTSEYTGDRQKLTQWRAFLRKGKLEIEGTELSTIAENLRTFLLPPTQSLISGDNFELDWFPNGPWQAKTG